jgi:Cu(I)/Ag(I) efflux system membrane fusion protein
MTTDPSSSPPIAPPPRSRRFGAGALAAVALVSAALGVGSGYVAHHHADDAPAGGAPGAPAQAKERWQCPMHPTVVQDHPGECPICGMKLVKMEATPPAGGQAQAQAQGEAKPAGARKVVFYRNPMDPKVTSHQPKKDEMGMAYLPVYEDEVNGAAPSATGLVTVNIDPSRQQLIGLRTAAVELGEVGGAWRTTGRVTVDETRVHHVNLKVGGYVGHTEAGFVGQAVKRGEPLFTLYSPELLAAQDEYLLALRTREKLKQNGAPGSDGQDLVDASRRKLELWDVPEAELRRMEETGVPVKEVTFFAPAPGVITKRDALPGMRLNPGDMPIELVDLSRVWVRADVYESELRHVKTGMPATLSLKAYPNQTFKGRVAFVDPLLDPKTRTVAVRIEFANAGGELKPEMFGEVVLQGAAREGLRVPTDAVVDSGTQSVVFVALGDGKFQPRPVQLGNSDGKHVEVVSGVTEGEQVVTRANFLVDSESRLRASLAAMAGSAAAPAAAAAGTPSASASRPQAPDAAATPAPAAHEGH